MTPRKSPSSALAARAWVQPFLVALSKRGIVTEACDAAQVSRTPPYELRRADEAFAAAWDEALEVAADKIEQEIHRRLSEPQGNRGSDVLLMFQAKAMRPNKYREKPTGMDITNNEISITFKIGDEHGNPSLRGARDGAPPIVRTVEVEPRELPAGDGDEAEEARA